MADVVTYPAVTPLNQPNNTQYFEPIGRGKSWEAIAAPIKPSVEIAEGTALVWEVSGSTTTGYLIAAVGTNANGQNFYGILNQPVTSSDPDYASTTKTKEVLKPITPFAEAYFAVGSGTLSAADIGKVVQFYTGGFSLAVDTIGAGAVISGVVVPTAQATSTNPARGVCTFSVPVATTA